MEQYFPPEQPWFATFIEFPDGRGRMLARNATVLGRGRLPTDSIGAFNLTLTNVVVGSSIDVQLAGAGDSLYNGTAAESTVAVPLPAYTYGNPNNSLRVKVRKGSASPYYVPYETLVTAFVGAQSIYISQIPDE